MMQPFQNTGNMKGKIMKKYKTVFGEGEREHIEKKSRFIGSIKECDSEEEARDFIDTIKSKYPDARHHCYAYSIGEHKEIQKYSDDGEPQGTAGIPILEFIKKEDLTNLCILVTRYFGGVLLGKGGLIRAYGKGAKIAAESVPVVNVNSYQRIKISFDYSFLGSIENTSIHEKWHTQTKDYLDKVYLTYLIEEERTDSFIESINNLTGGKAKIEILDILLKKESGGKLLD